MELLKRTARVHVILAHSMNGAQSVRNLFREYSSDIDTHLVALFRACPDYALYKHMAYFMGFRDEALREQETFGGKRFRSALCLMLADFLGVRGAARPAALSLELFHNFTLIHDDIVDGDTRRRGRPTVWKLWGVPHAINSGDGQLLLALSVLSKDEHDPARSLSVQSFLTAQYLKVIEGQYLDFMQTECCIDDSQVTEAAYFEMVGKKTADLIAAATGVTGYLAEVSEEGKEALFSFGYNLGIAYQICDDTVSIWGSEAETGKRAYGDILERKKTLPVLYAYRTLNPSDRATLAQIYTAASVSDSDAREVVALLDSVGTYEAMHSEIQRYAAQAKEEVHSLSLSAAHTATLTCVVDALLPDVKVHEPTV